MRISPITSAKSSHDKSILLAGGFSLLQESVTVLEWNLLYQLIASESPVYRSSIGLFLDHPSSLLHLCYLLRFLRRVMYLLVGQEFFRNAAH